MISSVLGFSLFLLIEFICFHGTILFPGLIGISQELSVVIMTVSLLSKTTGYFGTSLFATLRAIPYRAMGKVGVFLFAIGVALMPTLGAIEGLASLAFVSLLEVLAIGTCIGVGDALISLVWGHRCAALPAPTSYVLVFGSHLVATLLYGLTFFVPETWQVVLVCGSLILVFVSLFKVPLQHAKVFSVESFRGALKDLWRPLFGTSVFCFLAGLLPWISGQYNTSIETMRAASFLSTLGVLVLFLIPAVLIKKSFRLESVFKLILPVFATGFLLLPFIGNAFGGIVNVFAGVGAYAASVVLWCLVADKVHQRSVDAAIMFGLLFGIVSGASALGRAFGYFGGQAISEGDVIVTTISLVSLYLLSMIALVIFKRKEKIPTRADDAHNDAPSDPGQIDPGKVIADPLVTQACAGKSLPQKAPIKNTQDELSFFEKRKKKAEYLSIVHSLSTREAEVLDLLVLGYTMSDIARMLTISENTARTYIKRVYKKLDVHSKQEIIDLCQED